MYGINLKYLSLLLYFFICIPTPHVSLPFFGVIGVSILQIFSFTDEFILLSIENLFLLLSILGIILFINKRLILNLFGQLLLITSVIVFAKTKDLKHFEFTVPFILHLLISTIFFCKIIWGKNEKQILPIHTNPTKSNL